jgi:UDP-glucose 4-epimerase
MNKKILITGTGGYVGTSFQKYIDQQNAGMPPEDRWHVVFLSVRDDSWKKETLGEYDAILHAAGIVHRKEQPDMEELYHRVNTGLTRELAAKYKADRMAQGKKAHFIFLSTMSVYGMIRGTITADTPPAPNNFYGKSKLAAEEELRRLEDEHFTASIVRPPMIYGYQCTGNYASLEKLAKKIPLFPKVNNQRSMLYIDNLCEFLRLLIASADAQTEGDAPGSRIYCPQNAQYVNTSQLVAQIRSANGKKMHLVPGFSGLIGLLAKRVRVFAKVFGSLTYAHDMSEYDRIGDYQIIHFAESVQKSSSPKQPAEASAERCPAAGAAPAPEDSQTQPHAPHSKVSVLMSLYIKEKPEYFRASMDSILAQTYPADEVVLIEDGPLTEELYRAVAEYEELCKNNDRYPDLHIHAFPENRKLGRALAKGVELCRNELVARMDTDDIAMPERLAKQVAYMESHVQVSVSGGAIREFNDEGTTDRVKQMPKSQEEILNYVKLRNPLNHMTVIFRRSAILEAGNYQHFPYLEDYSLWSRMLAAGYQIRNLDDVLVKARTSMNLVKRRSGWSYYQDFKKLRKLQHELKLTNTLEYAKALVGTFIVLMQPGWVKELAYKKILRK